MGSPGTPPPPYRAFSPCMADPNADHSLVYTDNGILGLYLSPFFDPQFSDAAAMDGYIERVCFLLKETVEAQLGINHWHQILPPNTTLHPSYAALQRGLTSRLPRISGTVATQDVCLLSSTCHSTAVGCRVCSQILPAFSRLSSQFQELSFIYADIDECPETTQNIRYTPTFHFYRDGEKVDEMLGTGEERLRDRLWLHS